MSDTAYNAGPAMMAARGQTYGKRQEQIQAQQAVPMRKPPTEAPPAPLTPLLAPTQRPEEPITAGAPFGPGVGPEALGVSVAPQIGDRTDLAMRVRAIASQFPNAALLGLLAELEA